jgi:uncharacterized protein
MVRRFLALVALAVVAVTSPLRAEDDPQNGNSYLPLYPTSDIYQVQVIGDGIADGLLVGLNEAFRGDNRVQIKPKVMDLDTLMRAGYNDQAKAIDDALTRDQPTVAVVMIGPQDRVGFRPPGVKKQLWIDSDEWKDEFARQIDNVMKSLKRHRVAVYWVSLPNVRRPEPNEDVQVLNEIVRERVVLNGFKYIDAYAGFADEGGGYSAMGPDLAGKIRLLREQNGVAFTEAGNRKLAHFVEREFKRDLTQAKSDRTIPLAGNEAEQAAINASKAAAAKIANTVAAGKAAGVPSVPGGAAVAGTVDPSAVAGVANGDQKPDNGRINLAIVALNGREEIIPVDLLRPTIPAGVLALVNRKENADKLTQMGDLLIDQIPGGLMVMSSITPANPTSGESRRLSPTQTPYFRVMVKGERITPRADRADDASWPRSEPPPVVEPAAAVVVPDPADRKPAAKPKSRP